MLNLYPSRSIMNASSCRCLGRFGSKVVVSFCCTFRRIVLNNPKKRNALSLAMLTSLQEDILAGIDDKDLRVIIISGRSRLVR